jgi:citrate synthase
LGNQYERRSGAAAMSAARSWVSAEEAAAMLRVSRATLYAYVSRGFIRSQPTPGRSRARGYARDDVERLRRRTEERRDPDKAAARALQWGMPILESSIAFIDGRRLYYRGHDAAALARSRSVEEVASLIWTGRFDTALSSNLASSGSPRAATASGSGTLPFVTRAQTALAGAAARDPLAFDVRPASVAPCGWRILHLLTAIASGRERVGDSEALDRVLARAWGVEARGGSLLRSALILCADHELNVSSFTARCVASAGSNPYSVVVAGLAALEGPKHGGASARVEAMLGSMRRARNLRGAVAERLGRGETIDGFGHPLYPDGDPRAAFLVALLRERYARSTELGFVLDFADTAASAMRERPNIDFALAAVARVLRLPTGAPLTLFALGRSIGWIGHAIEQYATGQLIRPRAKYVGVVPDAG